ncbi:MAG: formylmethanofuran dehydrogenase subunit E family protein [Candidatus Bathyarchaeia archaeon]
MLDDREALMLDVKNAEKLHGHLGPFLVIGVKMARMAKKALNLNQANQWDLRVFAELPLETPFSCILDGIQATTRCTVGNRRLKIRNSNGNMTAVFKSRNKILKVRVKPHLVKTLRQQLLEGVSNEKLAWALANTPEDQMFDVETDKSAAP